MSQDSWTVGRSFPFVSSDMLSKHTHTRTHKCEEIERKHEIEKKGQSQAECVPEVERGERDLAPASVVSVFWAPPWVQCYLLLTTVAFVPR